MSDTQGITAGNQPAISTGDLQELAGLVQHHVSAWQDFGYETPPTPESRAIPPLGERPAVAITAGHKAIDDIDRLTRRLYELRNQLADQLRADSDIRGRRVDAMLAARKAGAQ